MQLQNTINNNFLFGFTMANYTSRKNWIGAKLIQDIVKKTTADRRMSFLSFFCIKTTYET